MAIRAPDGAKKTLKQRNPSCCSPPLTLSAGGRLVTSSALVVNCLDGVDGCGGVGGDGCDVVSNFDAGGGCDGEGGKGEKLLQ